MEFTWDDDISKRVESNTGLLMEVFCLVAVYEAPVRNVNSERQESHKHTRIA